MQSKKDLGGLCSYCFPATSAFFPKTHPFNGGPLGPLKQPMRDSPLEERSPIENLCSPGSCDWGWVGILLVVRADDQKLMILVH